MFGSTFTGGGSGGGGGGGGGGICTMRINAIVLNNWPNLAFTKVLMNQADVDTLGVADIANNEMVIKEAGAYWFTAQVYSDLPFIVASCICGVGLNGSGLANLITSSESYTVGAGQYPIAQIVPQGITLAVGDKISLVGRQNSGAAHNFLGGVTGPCCYLTIGKA